MNIESSMNQHRSTNSCIRKTRTPTCNDTDNPRASRTRDRKSETIHWFGS